MFSFSDEQNYIDDVHLGYLTLLHVSAVQISHHLVRYGYTKKSKGERDFSLQTVGMKL
jgi:hypothetical protein